VKQQLRLVVLIKTELKLISCEKKMKIIRRIRILIDELLEDE